MSLLNFSRAHVKNYTTHDLELGAVMFALKLWRHYLDGTKCVIYSDHKSLQHLFNQKDLNMRQRRWMETLNDYDCEIRYNFNCIKGSKHQTAPIQDVQNMIKKIKRKMYGDRTPMQILESMLQEERYFYFTKVNPSTNAAEEIFFVHQDSYNMWRAFPHVLMIDATYKTNEYKLPFIQVVGVTSTHKSFCVAHAFVSKEKKDNFLWVLEKLKELLVDCMEPREIVTDRDQALMNACDKVFPKASKLLCRWHISQNILKHCRAKFTDEDWKIFKLSWSRLYSSPTPTLYNYNFQRLFTRLVNDERSDVLDYLYDVWLKDYKEKFVSAWTNTVPNFGQHTTNKVESQHSKFKRYIKGPNNSLHRLVCLVGKVVESQKIQIKLSFQESGSVQMGDHRFPFFDNLCGNVSQKALELLVVERKKLHALRAGRGTCSHQLSTGCGLPCLVRWSGGKIQVAKFHLP
ncbi:putative MULE transposase domain, FHY3/FAR1 family, reverse transcriptase, RNase H-like protein [Helianthus annuus]|nr:putative MULE transposase domain, FHY3/FAR1 family, reverse transcriptase, RNase H-like protein [Helianthus annuus]KAJ0573112.1 putative MULE transposase domain, FHY3/FAR1 family, reverse transcriptase, RNase H-like protein [Helianthus annuus]